MPAFGTVTQPARTNLDFAVNTPAGFPSAYPEGSNWWTGLHWWSTYRWPPAITRAASLICNPLCRLPWIVHKPDGTSLKPQDDGYPVWLTDPALANGSSGGSNLGAFPQLERPTGFDLWSEWVRSALLRGIGLLSFVPGESGQPRAGTVQTLDPNRLYKGEEGWALSMEDGTAEPVDDTGMVSGQRLVVLRHSLPGGVLGWHREQVALANRMTEYSLATFTDSGVPTGVLSTDQPLTQKQADTAREEWNHRQHTRQIAVLGNGSKYQAVAISPVDSELIAMGRLSNEAIAHAFEMAAWWLDAQASSMTYANASQFSRELIGGPLSSWSARIEQTVGSLLPWGWRIEIDFSDYTRQVAAPPQNQNAADEPEEGEDNGAAVSA